jgi:hypothetical protein
MPAKAGIQVFSSGFKYKNAWIPACAGMTETEVDFHGTDSKNPFRYPVIYCD